eukprot:gene18574-21819_t
MSAIMPAIIWRALEPFPQPKKSEDGTNLAVAATESGHPEDAVL